MLKNYSRVFVGRPVEKPGWYAGSIKLASGPKDSGWRTVTIRLKQGCSSIDHSNLPAILRVDNDGCVMTFENDGKMRCLDVSGAWEYEEINVETYRRRGE